LKKLGAAVAIALLAAGYGSQAPIVRNEDYTGPKLEGRTLIVRASPSLDFHNQSSFISDCQRLSSDSSNILKSMVGRLFSGVLADLVDRVHPVYDTASEMDSTVREGGLVIPAGDSSEEVRFALPPRCTDKYADALILQLGKIVEWTSKPRSAWVGWPVRQAWGTFTEVNLDGVYFL
jgi:hypothetical protein